MSTSTNPILKEIGAVLKDSGDARKVYGDPVVAGDKIIIPVAELRYGVGGGFGHGNDNARSKNGSHKAEGYGGGGGMKAVPTGVIEVTATETRYIPFGVNKHALVGMLIGFALGILYGGRKAKSKYKKRLKDREKELESH